MEDVAERPVDRHARATGVEQRVGQAGKGVPPETEGDVDPEQGPGHLDEVVADGPPGDAVAHRGLEPAEEAGTADERFGLLDVLTEQGAGEAALPTTQAAGAAQGHGEEGQTEKGDGEDGAEDHGEADEGQADGGQAAREQVVPELGPGPGGEGLTPDAAGNRSDLGHLLFGEGERHLLVPHSHAYLVVLGLRHHHASRRASSTPPARTAATV